MAAGQTDDVKTVFGRCLMQCPSVDLWFMYLKFIKKVRGLLSYQAVLHLYCICTAFVLLLASMSLAPLHSLGSAPC